MPAAARHLGVGDLGSRAGFLVARAARRRACTIGRLAAVAVHRGPPDTADADRAMGARPGADRGRRRARFLPDARSSRPCRHHRGQRNTGAVVSSEAAPPTAGADWTAYGGSGCYSALSQITIANVKHLKLAWEFRTGDHRGPDDPDEITNLATPLKIGDLLYTCSPHQIVFALDGDRPVALEVRSTGPAQRPSST
ncbi:hypothetical protein GGD67_005733 [Bradyrhizobium sp. IAR9]|nr:hypothetical protein [Bradyrhizobium sp. IAR9]